MPWLGVPGVPRKGTVGWQQCQESAQVLHGTERGSALKKRGKRTPPVSSTRFNESKPAGQTACS